MNQRLISLSLAIVLLVLSSATARAKNSETPASWVNLQYSLERNGFDSSYIQKIFNDPRAEFLPNVVTKIAYLRKEKKADYSHFLTSANVEKGRRFLAAQNRLLTQAQNTYGVSKEVITAILTVESDLGNKTGNYPVFNVFSSLAVMNTPEVITMLDLNTGLMDRLQKKAAWGKSELCAFLTYCRQNRLDPLSIKGSWAGAFGYCQFLPSSILRSGADGNRDSCVNLFCYEDAVFSVANYLKNSGFRMGNQGSWSRAIHAYNHSDPYVDTVLTLAQWY